MNPVPLLSRSYASTVDDDGWTATVEHVGTHPGYRRNAWRWTITSPLSDLTFTGDDLTSAMDWSDPDPIAALCSLGSFLGSYADTRHHDEDALFRGLPQDAAGSLAEHIMLTIDTESYPPDEVGDPLLEIHAYEVDQDGRGPNEWLVNVRPNPDEPDMLLCSTSSPAPLLASLRAAGVTVVEHLAGEEDHPWDDCDCPDHEHRRHACPRGDQA